MLDLYRKNYIIIYAPMKEFFSGFTTGIVVLILGLVGLLAFNVLLTSGERFEEHYATFYSARSAGAVERGWLPKSLPAVAFNIRSYGDLDTNYSFGSFNLPPGAWSSLSPKLEPTEEPSNFRIDAGSSCVPRSGQLTGERFEFFRERTNESFRPYIFAVNEKRECILFSNGL